MPVISRFNGIAITMLGSQFGIDEDDKIFRHYKIPP